MTPSRWAKIKRLFWRVRNESDAERVLRDASSSLAQEVRRMLKNAISGSDDGLQLANFEDVAAEIRPGKPWFSPDEMVAGRFYIVRLLGRGGMGEVYEARDTFKDSPVALKVLHLDPGGDPQAGERMLRKEVTLAQRVSHANICRIHDPYRHDLPDGGAVMVLSMELLRGQTLAELCAERGRVAPDVTA